MITKKKVKTAITMSEKTNAELTELAKIKQMNRSVLIALAVEKFYEEVKAKN